MGRLGLRGDEPASRQFYIGRTESYVSNALTFCVVRSGIVAPLNLLLYGRSSHREACGSSLYARDMGGFRIDEKNRRKAHLPNHDIAYRK